MTNQNNKEALKDLANKYLDAFATKDLAALDGLLSEDVFLQDPVIQLIEGKEKVLKSNEIIFSNCKEIKFETRNIFVDAEESTVTAQLVISIDGTLVEVVDILTVNSDLKISGVKAYLDPR